MVTEDKTKLLGWLERGAFNEQVYLFLAEELDLHEVEEVFLDGNLLNESELDDLFHEYAFLDILEANQRLRKLEVHNAALYGLLSPKSYPVLEDLIVNHADLEEIIFAESAPKLRRISFVDNSLKGEVLLCTDMPLIEFSISNNPNLKAVNFGQHDLLKVARMRQLPKFKVSHLERFSNLEELHIDLYNNTHAKYLPVDLKKLHLTVKEGTEFKHLPDFEHLEDLAVTRSTTLKVLKLPELPNLKRLDISYNVLIKLPDFSLMPNLKQLYVKGNALKDVERLKDLEAQGVQIIT